MLIIRAIRRPDSRTPLDLTLIAWLLLPILTFTVQWAAIQPHYMIPLMPVAYILAGVGFTSLWQAIKRPAIRRSILSISVLLLLTIATLQLYMFAALLRFIDTTHTPGGFGTPHPLPARLALGSN